MKNFFKKIKEIKEKPNGNAIIFFTFYAFFFLFLILFLRFSSNRGSTYTEYERGLQYYIDYNSLSNNNYSYKYIITLDGNSFEFVGDKYSNTEKFTYNSFEYYKNDDTYFINNPIWVKTSNPNDYSSFVNINNISTIVEKGTYEYQTSYESGKNVYSFLISTDTLNNIISDINTDFDDMPNRMELSIDSNGNIEKISYYLDDYCKSNKICSSSLKIELNYSNFGNIKKIDNPIS